MKRTHAEHLDRMIHYGIITTPETVEQAHRLLIRIAPEVMSQDDVLKRWPRICAALINESLGYFTPRSAANAVLAHKLGRPYGCEYYWFSAGFERESPKSHEEMDAKLREVGRLKLIRAAGCVRYEGRYDVCADCGEYRNLHYPGHWRTFAEEHVFVNKPLDHKGCRHYRISDTGLMTNYAYALQPVRQAADGAANPPALLASWF
jgi:hypothetical protein